MTPIPNLYQVADTYYFRTRIPSGLLPWFKAGSRKKGKLKGRPERLWLPLVALLNGMRLNEIAQLHLDDVIQVNDIWCFWIRSNEEETKIVKI